MAAALRLGSGIGARRGLPFVYGLCFSSSSFSSSRVSFSHVLGRDRRGLNGPKFAVYMCVNGSSPKVTGFEANNTAMKHRDEDGAEVEINEIPKPYQADEKSDKDAYAESSVQRKRSAKLHDFCLGIPFGGIVFGAGLIGSLFSRSLSPLVTGTLFGGAILVLSTCSLKIWRQGKSSLPFILGQAAIAAAFLRKHYQVYSLTKNAFPSGFFILMSAAMLCFYSYVLIAGGNPPPKKLAANTST
ncbi:TMEM14 family protein [Dioscorea alata]|uniref:TMEM14 family protein n=1 Tax=Dioscorea alata TaxID=55571 RepID=A0ACB7VJL7_DIOAL|nr:TMEM14 family protein [Dioscorea alata]